MNSPTEPASAILDDFDSRPGSATSLIRTVLGAYVRDLGGWVAIADFVELMQVVGIPPESTRIAVTRLKKKGVLRPLTRDGRSGYEVTEQAEAMFTRGDPRIFGFRQMADTDPWRLISFTIPESQRAARHQLRRRLGWIGCGTVSPGLWIAPEHLAGEVGDIVDALGLSGYVTTFVSTSVFVPDSTADAAARWWDLGGIAARHRDFLDHHRVALAAAEEVSPRDAFVRFVPLLDEWRIIPYVDPGLPAGMLPANWPGADSVRLFASARDRYLAESRDWVRNLQSRLPA
ncbi:MULTISPECIES: PaaX family transcriptional regulator C-terminal domain-containing protein [unclassified Rhodococcus (in: high G+C Gram-positive bacteria)]|uniref:PaaX family transcriptional regulator n=1 Tax=unclassified Rhodococcus (in: high G+C Gram-positive bacteria) TaxID=192944 RepID=UPI00163A1275|nr:MULTISPECIES: PaaX family transcriptional regulator C-terminal domain-containing protein [unclassified Rhodococcus (in: high G+C Gram-positive bacteria)]MBC2639170.1 regulator [Rhodococcus sp. 3A]MBC2896087.1 regulator [Rhodococcus sp. 4CII]